MENKHSFVSKFVSKDCYLHGNDCIIMQLIVSSHANCVIESLLLKKDSPKV